MPYIQEIAREAIDPHIQAISENVHTVGDLNYVATRLALKFLIGQGLNYSDLNATMGMFICAMLEMYRRVGITYENLKLKQNGDVPEYAELEAQIRQMSQRLPANHAADASQAHG
jgi:hypothetical protein